MVSPYVHLDRPIELDAFLEADLERGAEGLQWGQQLPLGWLAIHLYRANVEMAGIQNDLPGLGIGGGLELVNDIAHQLLLVKQNIKVGGDVGRTPVVVVAQRVRITRVGDDGHSADGDELRFDGRESREGRLRKESSERVAGFHLGASMGIF